MIETSFGIIVGRFQVHELHDAHRDLINTVRGKHHRVVVFLGTPPTLATKRNPLDFVTRQRMLQAAYPDLTVLQIPDQPTNEAWSRSLDARIREVAQFGKITLYGSRDSFIPSYTGSFTPVTLDLPVNPISGEEVRATISNKVIESADFRAGVIYSTQNRWSISLQCVDIAITREPDGALLLGRKANENLWRFPGGHVDATDLSLEAAARREAREETALSELLDMRYIGSFRVDDWRYRQETDKIMTALFTAKSGFGIARAGDDLAEIGFFPLRDLRDSILIDAHRPLFAAFKKGL
jgi:bifunctional NMN adenylyltransferase/nudix hydrolase